MRSIAGLFVLAAWLVPGSAGAVTPDELVRLRQAGLGDEVLLALVDTTGVQGHIDAEGALELKRSGLSDRVIAAAIRRAGPPATDDSIADPPEQAAIDPSALEPSAGSGLSDMPSAGVTTLPQAVVVPWVVAPSRRASVHARHQPPTVVDPAGFGRFMTLYFHPLNDGVAVPPAPDTPAPHPRR
jgi:hypothetical protein